MRMDAASGAISPGIEAGRFVLATSVALFHWNGSLPSAYLAVDLFFIVSGLVIGRRYEEALKAGASIPAFAVGRAIRLYPLFLLAVAIGVVSTAVEPLVMADWSYSLPGLVWRALFLIPVLDLDARPVGIQSFPLDVPAWSLWCEVLANILFCVLCRLPRWVMAVPVLLGLAILAATAVSAPDFSGGGDGKTVVIGLGRIGFGFFAGVLLSRLPRLPVLHGRISWIALASVLGTLLLYFKVTETRPENIYSVLFIMVAVFPVLTLCIASCELAGRAARWCVAAGAASYAIYILHWPVYRIIRGIAAKSAIHRTVLDGAPVAIAVTLVLVGIATVATQHFDYPLRTRLNLWRRSLRPVEVVAAEGFEPPTKGL